MELSSTSIDDVRVAPSQTQSTITLHRTSHEDYNPFAHRDTPLSTSINDFQVTRSQDQSTVTLDKQHDEDYNPFEHRNLPHPTSTLGSFFHLLKSSLGTGILAMPAAFKQAGMVPGCIGTLLVAFIATHCVHIFVFTSREICREVRAPFLSYTDTCENVFKLGPPKLRRYSLHVRRFVDCTMAGMCIGGTSVYVIFIATALKDVVDHYATELSLQVYCAILIVPLVLITQIRYLKFLVPFSVFANISLVVTLSITYYYMCRDVPETPAVVLVNHVSGWPLFLSTAVFAMEGINVVMPVENEMEKPQHFLSCAGVLNATMMVVAVLYGVTGFFGYLTYGNGVSPLITMNLPDPKEHGLAMAAKILVPLAVFFTYCLQMYAPMEIIWTRIKERISKRYHNIGQICLRTFSVLLTVGLAVAIPNLEGLMRLVGAIFFSTLGLLIPAVVQIVHKWDRGLGKYNYYFWKNILLIIFNFIVLISGCYTAISDMVRTASP